MIPRLSEYPTSIYGENAVAISEESQKKARRQGAPIALIDESGAELGRCFNACRFGVICSGTVLDRPRMRRVK